MLRKKSLKILVLAGGLGKRLWPLAHDSAIKPLLKLVDDKSLLDMTLERYRPLSEEIYLISHQEINGASLIQEPSPRGTAAAVALALLHLEKKGASLNDQLLIVPTDQKISNNRALYDAITGASTQIDRLVLFGTRAKVANPNFGYILERGDRIVFKEKPSESEAQAWIDEGDVFWNMGLVLATIQTLREEFERYAPDYCLWRVGAKPFNELPALSLDHLLLEKSERIALAEAETEFCDLGTWEEIQKNLQTQGDENVFLGPVQSHACRGNFIRTQKNLIAIGLDDLIVIETEQGILIAKKSQSRHVKDLLETVSETRSDDLYD